MKEKNADRIFLEKGEQDQTTVANVSVMVYYTPAFKNRVSDLIGHSHIARLILTNKRWPGNVHDV